MQQYKFTVTFDDGSEKTVEIDQRDIRRWESEVGRSWLTEDMTVTSFAQVAHLGLVRAGLFTGSWDDFDRAAVWVQEVSDEKPARPTRKGRGGRPRSG